MTDASGWMVAGLVIVGIGIGLILGGRGLARFASAGLTTLLGALCLLLADVGLFAVVAAVLGVFMLAWPIDVFWKRLKGPTAD